MVLEGLNDWISIGDFVFVKGKTVGEFLNFYGDFCFFKGDFGIIPFFKVYTLNFSIQL